MHKKSGFPVGAAWWGVVWMASCLLAASCPAAYVILANGTRIDGTGIRAKSDGTITIETAAGSQTFAKGQYVKAEADRPVEIDEASKAVGAQQYDEAIKLLDSVALKYKMLGWDVYALKQLPQVYARKGDAAGAVQAYENLFRASEASAQESELMLGYLDALLKIQQYDKLEGKLDDLIAKGSRADAARAQLLRGDVKVAQNQLEDAVLDYLRTAILFKSETAVQPEALFKTAQTLEQLRDQRAKQFYQQVVAQYPASPEAAQAKAKL